MRLRAQSLVWPVPRSPSPPVPMPTAKESKLAQVARDASAVAGEQVKGLATQVRPCAWLNPAGSVIGGPSACGVGKSHVVGTFPQSLSGRRDGSTGKGWPEWRRADVSAALPQQSLRARVRDGRHALHEPQLSHAHTPALGHQGNPVWPRRRVRRGLRPVSRAICIVPNGDVGAAHGHGGGDHPSVARPCRSVPRCRWWCLDRARPRQAM